VGDRVPHTAVRDRDWHRTNNLASVRIGPPIENRERKIENTMRLPLYWVDAFASRPFTGNPAGVVPLETWLDDASMQRIAFENGISETAFFVRTGPARCHLRWFTPACEVDLCGHATLAGAFVLFMQLGLAGETVTFDSRSGPLAVRRLEDKRLELDFPVTPPAVCNDAAAARLVTEALGRAPEWLGESKFDLFAVLSDATAVRGLRPDLVKVAAAGRRGLIVTAPGDDGCDFVSRFFAPQSGVPEDPVTGSAHSALAPYWAQRLGRNRLHARQISARGGELWCELAPSAGPGRGGDRVGIAGHAVLYLRGEIEM
jgi:PhzF family phenazine biosynthesis protein